MPRDRIPVFQAVRGHGGRERKRQSSKEGQTPSVAITGNTEGARICAWPGNPEIETQRDLVPRTTVVVKDKSRS